MSYRKLGLQYNFSDVNVEENKTLQCPQCGIKSNRIENISPSKMTNAVEEIATCKNGHKWDTYKGDIRPRDYSNGYLDRQQIPLTSDSNDLESTTPVLF